MDNNLAKFEKSGMTELFENKEFGKLSVIIEHDDVRTTDGVAMCRETRGMV